MVVKLKYKKSMNYTMNRTQQMTLFSEYQLWILSMKNTLQLKKKKNLLIDSLMKIWKKLHMKMKNQIFFG